MQRDFINLKGIIMSDLIHKMALAVNTDNVAHYLGDLIHDGLMMAKAKPGDSYYWILKQNLCGTHLYSVDTLPLETLKRSCEAKTVYKIVVTGADAIGYPEGTLEKLE